MTRHSLTFVFVAVSLSASACTSNGPSREFETDASVDGSLDATVADLGTESDATVGADSGPACGAAVTCVDESISMLDLFDTASPAAITEEGTTSGEFTSNIDATGGGFMPSQSFVYARFTDAGLVKVDVDDQASFDSSEWDIAFRRYVVRLNSGVSGPSCVQGARTAPSTTFDSLTSVPESLTYHVEEYFSDTCEFIPDGSGIGAPGTVLSSFWTYPGCVAMSGYVYVVALANGRHVKLQVLSYYSLTNQEMCNTSGMVAMPSGAGAIRVRWAFLD